MVVVGGGLTGLEAATEIAEARPDLDVALAARGGLGDWLSPKGARHLRKVVDRLGITVHEHTAVTAVEADRVTTADSTIPAAVTVWTTGFAVHPIAQATALKTDTTGRIEVDGTMRSLSHPDVYAIGDAARVMGPGDKPLRMSCASGVPTAWQAADSIASRLTGTKPTTVPLRYFNQCISLGRRDGLIQYVTADDRARPQPSPDERPPSTRSWSARARPRASPTRPWGCRPGGTASSHSSRRKRSPERLEVRAERPLAAPSGQRERPPGFLLRASGLMCTRQDSNLQPSDPGL
ncbi:hypothetical protein SMICM304S_07775 [Streptomyces microflavus]